MKGLDRLSQEQKEKDRPISTMLAKEIKLPGWIPGEIVTVFQEI